MEPEFYLFRCIVVGPRVHGNSHNDVKSIL